MKVLPRVVALLLLSAGCSSSAPGPAPGEDSSQAVSIVATVEWVDPLERRMMLRARLGNVVLCTVDERVQDLSRFHPGDLVALTYIEPRSVQIVRKGESQEEDPAQGEASLKALARKRSFWADVVAVDALGGFITLRDAEGNDQTFHLSHPEHLSGIKVGDHLWIRFHEAVATTVEPVRPKAR